MLDGLRVEAAQPPSYQRMKTVVGICFVQTLQRVKVNRYLESNEDSINSQPEGKTKFLFPISLPARSLISREEFWKLRNSSEKRKRNNFDRNCSSRIQRKCLQIRGRIVEAAFHVPECDFFSKSLAARGTRDPAGFFSRC